MTAAKTEALRALNQIQERLKNPEPLDGLSRRMLSAVVDHAVENVEAIPELTRKRRAVKVPSLAD